MSEQVTTAIARFGKWAELQANVEAALAKQLTIAFLGSASAGKDAGIRALFGVDFGEVVPIPGSTDRIRVAELDADGRFVLVNAPGFGDLRRHVDATAREALEHLDVVVFVVNAEGGATIDEKRDLAAVKERGDGQRPTLVVLNKIDLIREHQREEFIARTCEQLQLEVHEAVAAAFDPLPQLYDAPLGVEPVIDWIYEHLESDGKALLFAKYLKNKAAASRPIIRESARQAALAGAIPVPGADITAVTAIQVAMVSRIAAVHEVELDRQAILWLIGEVLAGSAKGFIRWAIQALKAAGWLPGAQAAEVATSVLGSAVAVGATLGVGEAAIRYLQSDRSLSGEELRAIFDRVALKASKERLAATGTILDVEVDDP